MRSMWMRGNVLVDITPNSVTVHNNRHDDLRTAAIWRKFWMRLPEWHVWENKNGSLRLTKSAAQMYGWKRL